MDGMPLLGNLVYICRGVAKELGYFFYFSWALIVLLEFPPH